MACKSERTAQGHWFHLRSLILIDGSLSSIALQLKSKVSCTNWLDSKFHSKELNSYLIASILSYLWLCSYSKTNLQMNPYQ